MIFTSSLSFSGSSATAPASAFVEVVNKKNPDDDDGGGSDGGGDAYDDYDYEWRYDINNNKNLNFVPHVHEMTDH